jgi:hypothetical protein
MKHELALELKDAGFLSSKRRFVGQFVVANREPDVEDWYSPSLEELIEACGISFGALTKTVSDEWKATGFRFTPGGNGFLVFAGRTPTEAVAQLCLALNQKDANS